MTTTLPNFVTALGSKMTSFKNSLFFQSWFFEVLRIICHIDCRTNLTCFPPSLYTAVFGLCAPFL